MNYKDKHGFWIHKSIRDERSVSGYFVLRDCRCSECGAPSSRSKDVCPNCKAIMDLPSKTEIPE